MRIGSSTAIGAVAGLGGQGLAVGVVIAVAIAGGAGPNADLDAGEKFGALVFLTFTYGIAQVLVLGGCVALSRFLGRGSAAGLALGSGLGLLASLFYLCGG